MNKIISLNLLPPAEKKEASMKRSYLLIRNAILTLQIVTFCLTGLLLISKIILINQLTDAHEQLSLVNPTKSVTRQQIVSYNKKMQVLTNINKEFIPWSNVIWKITSVIPENIILNNLELDNVAARFIIEGNATARDDLLILEQNLKNVPWLKEVHLPLNNKLLKNNIDFTITAELVIDQLNLYED